MSIRPFLIIYCFVFFSACKKNKDKIPEGVFPRAKMQAVMWDIMRADQFLADFVFSKDTSVDKKKESLAIHGQIFSLHKISAEEFQRSFNYYKDHPALMKSIMDSIGAGKSKKRFTETTLPAPVNDTIAPTAGKPDTSGKAQRKKSIKIRSIE